MYYFTILTLFLSPLPTTTPIDSWNQLIVVRTFNFADIFYSRKLTFCLFADCKVLFNATKLESVDEQFQPCRCQCPEERPVFLTSRKRCVSFLEECRNPIRFRIIGENRTQQLIPTLFLPLKNNIFAFDHPIRWIDAGVDITQSGSVNCQISEIGLLTTNGWRMLNIAQFFQLFPFRNDTFMLWVGNSAERQLLQGGLVQMTFICNDAQLPNYCLAFRVNGRENTDRKLSYESVPFTEDQDRNNSGISIAGIDLQTFVLCLAVIFTGFGSVLLWIFCWNCSENRLVRKICKNQMENGWKEKEIFRCGTPMQLQMYTEMESQIASQFQPQQIIEQTIDFKDININENNHVVQYDSQDQLNRRKLQFDPKFFEPHLMNDPPQLARDFLHEIRRMIDIAKLRIRMKRHMPNLNAIPEEEETIEISKELKDNNSNYNHSTVVSDGPPVLNGVLSSSLSMGESLPFKRPGRHQGLRRFPTNSRLITQ